MATQILLYPSLSDTENYGLKIQSKGWSLSYHNRENELTRLQYKPAEIGKNLNFIETDGIWNADQNDLVLRNKIILSHYRNLFGPDGIACKNATLGISAIWYSADSHQRGSVLGNLFGISDADLETASDITSTEIDLFLPFPAASLRGDITLSVVIHIAKPGIPEQDENHLANEPGLVLGEISSFTLRIDGTGSLFPIYEVYEKDKPLWSVNCDWLNPIQDSFSESVSIYINKAHKNYKHIDQSDKAFCKQLLIEVMSAAVCCVIEEARKSPEWDQIIDDEMPEHGSVAEAIRYFQDTLEWDLSSPISVSESTRSFFDRRMTE